MGHAFYQARLAAGYDGKHVSDGAGGRANIRSGAAPHVLAAQIQHHVQVLAGLINAYRRQGARYVIVVLEDRDDR